MWRASALFKKSLKDIFETIGMCRISFHRMRLSLSGIPHHTSNETKTGNKIQINKSTITSIFQFSVVHCRNLLMLSIDNKQLRLQKNGISQRSIVLTPLRLEAAAMATSEAAMSWNYAIGSIRDIICRIVLKCACARWGTSGIYVAQHLT